MNHHDELLRSCWIEEGDSPFMRELKTILAPVALHLAEGFYLPTSEHQTAKETESPWLLPPHTAKEAEECG